MAAPRGVEEDQPGLAALQDVVLEEVRSEALDVAGEVGGDPLVKGGGVSVVLLVLDIATVSPGTQGVHPDGGVAGDAVLPTELLLLLTVNLPNSHGGILLQHLRQNHDEKAGPGLLTLASFLHSGASC